GRLYYSRKGDKLPDWQGAQAPTLDAFEATNRALMNIANLSSFSDYKITAVQRWINAFEKYMDVGSVGPNATNMQKFFAAKPNALARQHGVEQAMLDQRDIIQRNLGWKTNTDRMIDEQRRRLAEWVMGREDRKSTRLNSSHVKISYAV